MRNFKTTDLFISIALIVGFTIYCLIKQDESILIAYFVVGGWQVISMLVHAYNKWFSGKGSARYIYHWIAFISVVTMPAGSVWILAVAAPFMAVYYAWLCYQEVYVKMRRPMALLK